MNGFTDNLLRDLVKIAVGVREMVDPCSHKITRQEQRKLGRGYALRELLEYEEAPVLAL